MCSLYQNGPFWSICDGYIKGNRFVVICKDSDFECWYIRTDIKETPSNISDITFTILPFYQKKIPVNCQPESFRICYSWFNHQIHFIMVHSNKQNAKFSAGRSQVCYSHTTHLSACNKVKHIIDHLQILKSYILGAELWPQKCTLSAGVWTYRDIFVELVCC